MSELTDLRDAINRLTGTIQGGRGSGSGGSSTVGVAAGAALGGIIEGGNLTSAVSRINVVLNDISQNFFLFSRSLIKLLPDLDRTNKGLAKFANEAEKAANLAAGTARKWAGIHSQIAQEYEGASKSLNKFSKGMESVNTFIKRMGLGVIGFAAVGLKDTSQGYQLTYQLGRLAYEIADALLPVIKSFTKSLAILNLGLHKINQGEGNGFTKYALGGLAVNALLGGLPASLAIRMAPTLGRGLATGGRMAWGGLRTGAELMGEGFGGSAAAGAAVGMTMLGGLGAAIVGASRTNWRQHKSDPSERFDMNYDDYGYPIKKKEAAAKPEEKEHLTPIYHTSFGAIDKLWEQMQALSTENPAQDTAVKQLDVLENIALIGLNILEWLEDVPRTTYDEALKA